MQKSKCIVCKKIKSDVAFLCRDCCKEKGIIHFDDYLNGIFKQMHKR